MKKVTTQEIVDFIFAQPRDRKVEMKEASSCDSCGCLMVQYGKEELKIEESFVCGLDNWTTPHGGNVFQMDYNDIRVATGFDFSTLNSVNGLFEAGVAFEREIYFSGANTFDPTTTIFLRTGLAY